MNYVYILHSRQDNKFYIGQTSDLRRRLGEHLSGKVRSTKGRRPLVLCFYEAFVCKEDAERRERYFKTSKGRSTLQLMLRQYLHMPR